MTPPACGHLPFERGGVKKSLRAFEFFQAIGAEAVIVSLKYLYHVLTVYPHIFAPAVVIPEAVEIFATVGTKLYFILFTVIFHIIPPAQR